MSLTDRFEWALKLLDVRPEDIVLEIGCGAGILAQSIAEQISTGQIIAIDKSKSMIKSAITRNAAGIDNKKIQLLVQAFVSAKFKDDFFDKIIAFNVNDFMRKPTGELALVRKYLKSSGRLFLFYQPPYEINNAFIEQAKKALLENNFVLQDVVQQKMKPHSSLCIISRPL